MMTLSVFFFFVTPSIAQTPTVYVHYFYNKERATNQMKLSGKSPALLKQKDKGF